MTNINCSNDCIYQEDGKCRFESVMAMSVTHENNCAYYAKADDTIKKKDTTY